MIGDEHIDKRLNFKVRISEMGHLNPTTGFSQSLSISLSLLPSRPPSLQFNSTRCSRNIQIPSLEKSMNVLSVMSPLVRRAPMSELQHDRTLESPENGVFLSLWRSCLSQGSTSVDALGPQNSVSSQPRIRAQIQSFLSSALTSLAPQLLAPCPSVLLPTWPPSLRVHVSGRQERLPISDSGALSLGLRAPSPSTLPCLLLPPDCDRPVCSALAKFNPCNSNRN